MHLFGAAAVDRRNFLTLLPCALASVHGLLRAGPGELLAGLRTAQGDHPDPRPDVDASKVMTAEELAGVPHVVDLFDAIREIPHVVDGIRCHCGCADLEGYRSLLTCFEGPGAMAMWCEICQGEGRLAVRRHAEGQSLAEIRRAIDARFGTAGGHDHASHARARAHSHEARAAAPGR
jgi:hypothetical protein